MWHPLPLNSHLFPVIASVLCTLPLLKKLEKIVQILNSKPSIWSSLVTQMVKNLPEMQETRNWSLGREDPLEKGRATLVSLPGGSHGQGKLAGYSPWGCRESDTTEWLTQFHFQENKKFTQITKNKAFMGVDAGYVANRMMAADGYSSLLLLIFSQSRKISNFLILYKSRKRWRF